MGLDMSQPLGRLAYAWCGECSWLNRSRWAHVRAQEHSEKFMHVVHIEDGER